MRIKMKPIMLAAAACLSLNAANAGAQPLKTTLDNPAPERVLFIGNSYFYYNDSLHNHVSRLLASLDPELGERIEFKSATIGGAALNHHPLDSHLAPGRLGIDEPFELVILQGGSAEPLSEPRRAEFARTAAGFSRGISAAGAETALYMTHAYQPPHPRFDPGMIESIESLYVETANEIGALAIPVGLAFEEAYRRRSGIALHKSFDGSHPDLLGTYLAACVIAASVWGLSPVGSDYDYFGAINRDDARFLQQVAEEVVAEFQRRQSQQPRGASESNGNGSPSPIAAELDGAAIIELAHEAAGGETFTRPGTLFLAGSNIIYDEGGGSRIWDRYAMWRVFADEKADAHAANGKVRIEAWSGGELAMLLSFDGQATYDQSGRMADQSANAMWSNSFGFGAIRNALDAGWTQERRADRAIDGKPAYLIELTDPSGGRTLFGIDQATFDILYVGFNTPRGWHERRYSGYFSKPGINWRQAGRVRLFYNGVKSNEAIWTDFQIGDAFGDAVFVIDATPGAPTF